MYRFAFFHAVVCAVGLAGSVVGFARSAFAADDSPQTTLSRHQMMKECMAKQKASDGGMPKEDMKRNCRDVTQTEAENAKAEQAEENAEKADSAADEKPASP